MKIITIWHHHSTLLLILVVLSGALFGGCAFVSTQSTPTPYPTMTPYPTNTPNPTTIPATTGPVAPEVFLKAVQQLLYSSRA